jgi:DNA-binding transcriptional regulator YiaG
MKNQKLASLYVKSVRWSEEDDCFVGTVHGLVGDCSHGKDPAKVFAECEKIALECVEAAMAQNRQLPKVKGADFSEGPDAASIRRLLGMSQVEFAKFLSISPKTLHKWEQGTSQPSGAARSLLRLAAEKPKTVLKVLS